MSRQAPLRALRWAAIATTIVALSLATAPSARATGAVHYVRAEAAGQNDGSSWANAYTSLQAALAVATAGDQIWVAAGTYRPSTSGDRTASFVLGEGVALYGGFAGSEQELAQRSWTANLATLSGDLAGDDEANFANNGENSYTVVTGAPNATLDGFAITGGNATEGAGGGLYSFEDSLALANLTISGNHAEIGGGIYSQKSTLTLTNVTIRGNDATTYGGAIHSGASTITMSGGAIGDNTSLGNGAGLHNVASSTLTLSGVTISGNETSNGGGGGLYNINSSAVLTGVSIHDNQSKANGAGIINTLNGILSVSNSTLSDNSSQNSGGGIFNHSSGTLTVAGSVFSGNSGTYGGAIDSRGTLTLSGSTISANTATAGGGGLSSAGTFTVADSLFHDNSADDGLVYGTGGALQVGTTTTIGTISNTTFSGNRAQGEQDDGGGAIMVYAGSLSLTNVTIAGNSTASGGNGDNGGGGINANSGATITLRNSIVAGNSSPTGRPDLSGAVVSGGNNLIGDTTGGNGITTGVNGDLAGSAAAPLDPRLVALAANGGPTHTLALRTGSPAIDAGNGASCPAADGRGYSRVAPCDIGAYEAGALLAPNQAPTLDQPADLSIQEDAGVQTLALEGIDAGARESQALFVSAVSSNPALIPTALVSYTSPGSGGALSFTPNPDSNGSATITVTVRDDGGSANGGVDTTSRTFTVTIASINDAPDFTAGASQQVVSLAGAQTVTGWASGFTPGPADEAGQTPLGYAVVSNSAPELFAVAPTVDLAGTLTYTPLHGASGTATIGIAVQDSGGNGGAHVDTSPTHSFTITLKSRYTLHLPLVARP